LNTHVQFFIAIGIRAVKLVATSVGYVEVIPVRIAVLTGHITELAGEAATGTIGFEVDVITLGGLVIAHGVVTGILGVGWAIPVVETGRRRAFPGVQCGVYTRGRADIARIKGATVGIAAVPSSTATIDDLRVDTVRVDTMIQAARAAIIAFGVRRTDTGNRRMDTRSIHARIGCEL